MRRAHPLTVMGPAANINAQKQRVPTGASGPRARNGLDGMQSPAGVHVVLKGKSAVVTGSTSGIGLGIARALAASGANILLNGFGNTDDIERLRKEFKADH